MLKYIIFSITSCQSNETITQYALGNRLQQWYDWITINCWQLVISCWKAVNYYLKRVVKNVSKITRDSQIVRDFEEMFRLNVNNFAIKLSLNSLVKRTAKVREEQKYTKNV